MSNMLNRFVKIIEQVDPEQNNKQQKQQQVENYYSNDDETPLNNNHNNDLENQNHHASVTIGDSNNNHREHQDHDDKNNTTQNFHHRDDEITDYDISDPFVAEYNHNKRSSAKRRDDDGEESSSFSPAPVNNNNHHHNNFQTTPVYSSSAPTAAAISAQHQYDQFLDSSASATHYLNYLNRTGSFDVVKAVGSNDVKALLERIAALESSIIQANYERQVLQCRLENNNNNNSNVEREGAAAGEEHFLRSDETHPATHQETLRHLRRALVEQIEKNDALARDFQGRVVQLEYDLVVARKKQQELESKLASATIAAMTTPQVNDENLQNDKDVHIHHQKQHHQQRHPDNVLLTTAEESSQSSEKLKQLEAKLLDAQKKNDAMQRKAAEALQKSTLRESTIQQELEFVQKELLETRKRLIEAQKPIDHQLEDQLKKTTVFAKITSHTSTAWGDHIANVMGGIDRCGVRVGRFFANHAMIRFFFVVYVIGLHIYIFHLFAAVLHHMETTSDDVHEHLNKLHQQHGAAHP